MDTQRAENVILISLDGVRPESLGCYGSGDIRTPVIDEIAGRGTRFTRAISQAPFAPASNASFLTGLNPNRHGIRFMPGQRLRPVTTLAEIFHSAGWSTAAFVGAKNMSREYGFDRGFSLYDDEFDVGETENSADSRRDCAETTSKTIKWTKNRRRSFVFLHFYDVHSYSVEGVSPLSHKHGLEAIDAEIQRLIDHVQSSFGIGKTAIVIFSDHAGPIAEDSRNCHLERLFNATLRVPLLMNLPGLTCGQVIEHQVRGVDVFPTLIEYFGLSPLLPREWVGDGISLIPLMEGEEEITPRSAFSEAYVEPGGESEVTAAKRSFAVRTANLKLVYEKISDKWEGYDLDKDPEETTNVFDKGSQLFQELKDMLVEYIQQGEELEQARMLFEEDTGTRNILDSLGYSKTSSSPSNKVTSASAVLKEAQALISKRKYEEAVGLLSETLTSGLEESRQLDMQMTLADVLHRLGRDDEAIGHLESILEGPAEQALSARAAVLMSSILAEKESVTRALSVLDGFLEKWTSPTSEVEGAIRAKRAVLCREAHDYERAMLDYEWILRESPQDIDTYYNLGSLFKQIGYYPRAQACFKQVLRISTSHPDKYHGGAHYHLADIALKRSLRDHAEESLRECLKINPQHDAAKRELDRVASSTE